MRQSFLVIIPLLLVSLSALAGQSVVNDTRGAVYGLEVTFSEPVAITGHGNVLTLMEPVGVSTTFTFSGGELNPGGSQWLNWIPTSASIIDYDWIRTPTTPAASVPVPHDPILIRSDSDFVRPGSGVVGGSGTSDDPYVIAGWSISGGDTAIYITRTSKHFVVRDCLLSGSGNCVLIAFSENGAVEGCTVKRTATGCSSDMEDTFNSCGDGICVFQSMRIDVRANHLEDIRGSGISLYGSSSCVISGNEVTRCAGQGIEISRGSRSNKVLANAITRCGGGVYYGLCVTCDSCGNEILRNVFSANTPGAIRNDRRCADNCVNVVEGNIEI